MRSIAVSSASSLKIAMARGLAGDFTGSRKLSANYRRIFHPFIGRPVAVDRLVLSRPCQRLRRSESGHRWPPITMLQWQEQSARKALLADSGVRSEQTLRLVRP